MFRSLSVWFFIADLPMHDQHYFGALCLRKRYRDHDVSKSLSIDSWQQVPSREKAFTFPPTLEFFFYFPSAHVRS